MSDLHRLICDCAKQDIPEVELVIAILTPVLEQWWVQVIEDALRQGDLIVGRNPATSATLVLPEQVEAEVVAAFEQVLLQRVRGLSPDVSLAVEQARDQLLEDALAALGAVTWTQETIDSIESTIGPVRAGAIQDMATLMAGRVETRLPEIRTAVRAWSRAARADAGIGGQEAPGAPETTPRTPQAREAVERILGGLSPRSWVPFVADQWGYRWFNIWEALDALAKGVVFFEAQAVRDGRTTPFCLWVHGKVVSAEKIRAQIRSHVNAVMRGDIDSVMNNWPLLDPKVARLEGAQQDATFGQEFARLGIPPYHHRCRTTLRPVQL